MERAMMKEVTVHAQRKIATSEEMKSVGARRSNAAPVQKSVKRMAAPREKRNRVVVNVMKTAKGGKVRLVRIARKVYCLLVSSLVKLGRDGTPDVDIRRDRVDEKQSREWYPRLRGVWAAGRRGRLDVGTRRPAPRRDGSWPLVVDVRYQTLVKR